MAVLTLVESTFLYDAILISSASFKESGAHLKDVLYIHLTSYPWIRNHNIHRAIKGKSGLIIVATASMRYTLASGCRTSAELAHGFQTSSSSGRSHYPACSSAMPFPSSSLISMK